MTGHRRQYLRDLHRVHRLEYPFPIAYLCHALWGACFAATSLGQLLRVPVLVAVAANLITLVAQNVLNAAMDIPADSRTPGKSGVARAAMRLGTGPLIRWAALEMALALLLAVASAAYLGRPLVAVGVAAGIVVEGLYNLEPVRLKKRGMANPISLGLHFSFLPCVSTFNAVRPDFPGFVWPLFCGLWLLLIGRTLWWSLPDAAADRAAGLSPPAVRYGLTRALALASAASAAALALIAWGLWWDLGPLAAALGTATSGVFLVGKVRMSRMTGRGAGTLRSLHESRMRARTLVYVVSADLFLLVLAPLGTAQASR